MKAVYKEKTVKPFTDLQSSLHENTGGRDTVTYVLTSHSPIPRPCWCWQLPPARIPPTNPRISHKFPQTPTSHPPSSFWCWKWQEMILLVVKMTVRTMMMGLAAKALPCVLPPLELQLPPPPARAHKSFLGCAAQLPLIIASAATLLKWRLLQFFEIWHSSSWCDIFNGSLWWSSFAIFISSGPNSKNYSASLTF